MLTLPTSLRHIRTTTVIVTTLATASGPLAVAFGLFNPPGLTEAGIRNPDSLIEILRVNKGSGLALSKTRLSYPDIRILRAQATTIKGIAAEERIAAEVEHHELRRTVTAALIDSNYFAILGVGLQRGSLTGFGGSPDGPRIVVISDRMWHDEFNGARDIIGSPLRLHGVLNTVVGVTPPRFAGDVPRAPVDVWLPLRSQDLFPELPSLELGNGYAFTAIARMRPGLLRPAVQAELDALTPSANRSGSAVSQLTVADMSGDARGGQGDAHALTIAMWIVTALVLCIACVNIAAMYLARAVADRQSIAIRLALGASKFRLARDAAKEALVTSALGLGGGLLIAAWILSAIRRMSGGTLDASIDVRAFLFMSSVGVLTTLIFAAFPALFARTIDLNSCLKSSRPTDLPPGNDPRDVLVVLQIALSLVVVMSTVLIATSIRHLKAVDVGFPTSKLYALSLDMRGFRSVEARHAAQSTVMAEARNVRGVRAVAIGFLPLLRYAIHMTARLDTSTDQSGRLALDVPHDIVSPQYFSTLGVRVLSGRDFSNEDDMSVPKRLIVNRTFARQFVGDNGVIGRRLAIVDWKGARSAAEIIGVVPDFYSDFVGKGQTARVFESINQTNVVRSYLYIRAEREGAASDVANSVAATLGATADRPTVATIEEILDTSFSFHRYSLFVTSALAVIAIVLSIVGLYSMLSYRVTQRTREFGIRMALGADRRDVARLVGGHTLRITGIGVLLAVPIALFSLRLTRILLFETSVRDPWVALITLATVAVAVVAGALRPTLAAMTADPSVCMRDVQ
jgi:putative ABC transport system permease protein